MENVRVVQRFQTLDHLNEDTPDVLFAQVGLFFLVASDFLEKVAIVCVLHDDAIDREALLVSWIMARN